MNIGAKIRLLRESKGLTIKEIAAKTGYSSSFISQIERDVANPSINSLKQISDSLGVPLASFFDEERFEEYANNIVVRKENRKKLSYTGSKAEMFLLSPDLSRKIELLLIVSQPGGKSGKEFYQHKGEECGMVISGSMQIELEDKNYTLHEGDSIYFPSETPHRWKNIGEIDCVSIWAITPPSF